MENSTTHNPEVPEKKRSVFSSFIVASVGLLSVIYILNPTAGFLELIPDNVPVFGNLDEAAAVALLISSLAYFGVDIGSLFGRAKKEEPRQARGEVVE